MTVADCGAVGIQPIIHASGKGLETRDKKKLYQNLRCAISDCLPQPPNRCAYKLVSTGKGRAADFHVPPYFLSEPPICGSIAIQACRRVHQFWFRIHSSSPCITLVFSPFFLLTSLLYQNQFQPITCPPERLISGPVGSPPPSGPSQTVFYHQNSRRKNVKGGFYLFPLVLLALFSYIFS